jgi:hypothetical protein
VSWLRATSDAAFVRATVRGPDGEAIDWEDTEVVDENSDDPELWAYLERWGGRWTVLDANIGSTSVDYEGLWDERACAPYELFTDP